VSEFSNRVVIVTGAFGALGRAVAKAFADNGARVALIGHGQPPQALVQELGSTHRYAGGVELADPASTAAAFDSIAKDLGRIDVLVNIAGGFQWEKLEGGSIDTWAAMYEINLKTAVVAVSAALPHLLATAPGSRIVNVGAGAAAKAAGTGMGAYTASKAGVQKLTESLADELKDRGITVNSVLPGTIDTPHNRKDMPNADVSKWVAPAAIADVILFLASPRAAAVTGAAVPVFGRG
jgi:NAD(P)-dependent dehydrogenase (short-subunit alcohol dehydrogenase family)